MKLYKHTIRKDGTMYEEVLATDSPQKWVEYFELPSLDHFHWEFVEIPYEPRYENVVNKPDTLFHRELDIYD